MIRTIFQTSGRRRLVIHDEPFGDLRRRAFFCGRFYARRSRSTVGALVFFIAASVFGEPIYLPSYTESDRFEIVEKENVRRRVGGTYSGYVYREYRGLLHYVNSVTRGGERGGERRGGLEDQFDGIFYVLEDVSLLGNRARRLSSRVESSIFLSSAGPSVAGDAGGYPRTLEFPTIRPDPVEPGEKWRSFGYRYVEPKLDGLLTKIRFYCEYRFDGAIEHNGEEVYSIYARYALRYQAGDDPTGDPDLHSVSGSHKATILLYADGSGRVFVRTQVDESYRFSDGNEITQQGFLLTWLNEATALDRGETIQTVTETLAEEDVRGGDGAPWRYTDPHER